MPGGYISLCCFFLSFSFLPSMVPVSYPHSRAYKEARGKDSFETCYEKHLLRRLLVKRSASMNTERQMISKMKMEVGNQFTQRIEAMFKDMKVSEDLSATYKEHIAHSANPDQKRIDLDIHVLTSTMWLMKLMVKARDGQAHLPCIFPIGGSARSDD